MVAGVGLAAIALAGGILGYLPWWIAALVFLPSAGGAVWLRRRGSPGAKAPLEQVEGGLRMVDKPLAAGRPRLPHARRVTISTEVSVALGLRVICDTLVPEVEALAQTGRGSGARQGVPAAVHESRLAWLFVLRNSPGERELFLRVDLFAAQPFEVVRVEQIRPGVRHLPEWRELDAARAAAPGAPAAEPGAGAAHAAPPEVPVAEPGAGHAAPPEIPAVEPGAGTVEALPSAVSSEAAAVDGAAAGAAHAAPAAPAGEPAP